MLALHEVQAAFRRAILTGDTDTFCALVAADGLAPEERLGVYRNNVFASLTAALRETFPAVCRLVDERFFAYAAHEFICRHPPESAVLAEYGGRFPDFLAGFAPCRELVYLADVARLEWLMNVAANAAHANPIAAMTLADVVAEDAPRLTLQLHPSFGFVASRWPIDRIWRANRAEAAAEATIDLAAGGVWLEVSRADANIIMRALDSATFTFRSAVQRGETLARATEVALVADPAFDLCRALPALFLDGAIIAVSLAQPHAGREPPMTHHAVPAFARPRWQERLRALLAWLERFPLAILQLLFRISIAAVFWNSGLTKLASWQTTIVLFRDEYKVPVLPPELAATLATSVELTCPVLLVLGLATRLATLPMLGMTFIIEAFVYPEDWIEHLTWASLLLFILTRGPGPIALDRWLRPIIFGPGRG